MSRLKDLAAFLKTVPEGFTKWELELAYCLVILKRCGGNRLRASKLLGISLRSMSGYVGIIMGLVDDCPICMAGVKRYPDLAPVLAALLENRGSRINTARQLGISTTTLYEYIKELRAQGTHIPKAPPYNPRPPKPRQKRDPKAPKRRYTRNIWGG